jgi:hypothetical protein
MMKRPVTEEFVLITEGFTNSKGCSDRRARYRALVGQWFGTQRELTESLSTGELLTVYINAFHELGECLGYSSPPLLERLIDDAQKIYKQ